MECQSLNVKIIWIMSQNQTCFVAKYEARMINIRFVAMHRDESRIAFIGLVFGYDTLFN